MVKLLARFLSDLSEGNTVAWTFVAVVAGIALVICLIWWKIAYDLRRQDEADRKRHRQNGRRRL